MPVSVTLVVSPHLDDAVFSTGQMLAGNPGTVVVTVFAGVPPPDTVDSYDRACGFANSQQAMLHRRKEDETALSMLAAKAVHLEMFGIQYQSSTDEQITGALDRVVSEVGPDRVVGPIGLAHPDHQRVGALWRRALGRYPQIDKYAYEDLPYRLVFPRQSSRAISAFVRAYGAREAPLAAGDVGAKACAMLAYSTQLRTATPLKCLEPERLWRLADHDLEDV